MFEPEPNPRESQPQRLAFGNMPVPGTRVGAVVSIGIAVVAWLAIPVARVFILGTAGVGVLIGLFLWWLHSRE
jgi:hypothetical protein